jgi:multidrug resistance protein, MATE family
MIANLTTPLIGIVSTIAIGRLGDATLLGGVAIASVIFDCLFWLFAFLRMSTVAFTAQALGAGELQEIRAQLVRGLIIASLIGAGLIALQVPLAAILLSAMGGSDASPAPPGSTSPFESGRRRWRWPITSCSAG